MGKRVTNSHLMFIQIDEASRVIPLPSEQPLFLDVPTTSDVMDSIKPKSPHVFRGFSLHHIFYIEEGISWTQVAFPCLCGDTQSHLLNFQKQLLIPELQELPMMSATLAVTNDKHWNVINDPIYPACLESIKRRHKSSPAPWAGEPAKELGTGGGSPSPMRAPSLATSWIPLYIPVLSESEVMKHVQEMLDQVYDLRLKTVQEMGFIREVDRALAKSLMSEFTRRQLVVRDDLNTSLLAMHADLEVTTDELIRDLDTATQNSTDLPSRNPAVRVALHRFKELVKLKLALPLAHVDAAHEDMGRFLQNRLEELHSQSSTRNLVDSLSERIAAHQSRVCQVLCREPLKHLNIILPVIMGMAADQPVKGNFFSVILEGLLGRLGIDPFREMNPPTSSREGAAQ